MPDQQSRARDDYAWFTPITTRWADNDIYGHVNNVVYYAYFDSIANRYLIEEGGLDIHGGETIGFIVNSQCATPFTSVSHNWQWCTMFTCIYQCVESVDIWK